MEQQPTVRDYFVKSVMELIRIDTKNPMNLGTVERLTNCIPQKEFLNFSSFIATMDTSFMKPIEVIAKGVKEFEKLRTEQLKNTGLETEVRSLVNKCRQISTYAYEHKPAGLNFTDFAQEATWENFPNMFTVGETELLDQVGGCKKWLIDYDENSFLEEIISMKVKVTLNYNTAPGLQYKTNETIERLKLGHKKSA